MKIEYGMSRIINISLTMTFTYQAANPSRFQRGDIIVKDNRQ